MAEFRKYRHRVDFQSATSTPDDMGGLADSWATVYQTWAKVRPLQGNERYQAQQAHAETSIAIEMRYRPEINSSQRIIYRDRVFAILAAINEGMLDKKLILLCSEGDFNVR